MRGFKKIFPNSVLSFLPLLLILHVLLAVTNAASEHFGFQSGHQFKDSKGAVDGFSYGSSLHYDSSNDLLYITGSTYWTYWDNAGQVLADASKAKYMKHSDCFISVFKLPNEEQRSRTEKHLLEFMFADRFGVESVDEACSAITFMNGSSGDGSNMANMIVAGHTEEGGFLTSLRQLGSTKSAMYGFLINMNFKLDKELKNGAQHVASVKRNSDAGMLFNDVTTQYPVAITSNPNDSTSNEVYVITLASASKDENDFSQISKPDLSAAGGVEEPPYGKDFKIILQKIVRKGSDEISYELKETQYYGGNSEEEAGVDDSLRSGWTQIFSLTDPEYSSSSRKLDTATEGNASSPANANLSTFVRVADLKYIPHTNNEGQDDHLILAGTTNGYGEAFGRTEGGFNVHIAHHGFVTKLSTEGDVVATKSIHIEGKFVTIKGICYDKTNGSGVELFAVGETNGQLDETITTHDVSANSSGRFGKHAFITKLDFSTLDIVWSRQIGGVGGLDVTTYSCAASKSDGIVYMTGTVKSGGKLHVLQKDVNDSDGRVDVESAGGDDVFVANFNIENGKTNFVRQFGTSQDDSIAKGDGIVIDKNGDAIIMGNTKGSMMRWRGDGALSADGDAYDVFIMSVSKENGTSRVISEMSESSGTGGGNGDGDGISIPGSGDGVNSEGELEGFEIFAISMAAIVLFITALYVGFSSVVGGNDRSSGVDNSEMIIDYVREFHDDDVRLHVRHSATGGVHGIYSPVKSRQAIYESEVLEDGKVHREENQIVREKPTPRRVTFEDDNNTTNALVSSQDSLLLQSNTSNSFSPSQKSLEEQRNLHEALESVEADFKSYNHANVKKSTSNSYMNSTPVFDGGLIKRSPQTEQNAPRNIGATSAAPPSHAFNHKDDDDDDEWETELL